MENKVVVITKKDCCPCRFTLICVGSALFQTIPTLKSMTFDESCPRDWEALKDLVQYSVLPNRQSPTL